MGNKCIYGRCANPGKFAIYELKHDFTKVWRTDLCDRHEKLIASSNSILRKQYTVSKFRETK